MRIVAAAIRWNGLTLSKPAPARHFHIMNAITDKMSRATRPGDQGFITDEGAFVGRVEAKEIATAAGQIKGATPHKELFSEDLW